jgi:hypothetical protein
VELEILRVQRLAPFGCHCAPENALIIVENIEPNIEIPGEVEAVTLLRLVFQFFPSFSFGSVLKASATSGITLSVTSCIRAGDKARPICFAVKRSGHACVSA